MSVDIDYKDKNINNTIDAKDENVLDKVKSNSFKIRENIFENYISNLNSNVINENIVDNKHDFVDKMSVLLNKLNSSINDLID